MMSNNSKSSLGISCILLLVGVVWIGLHFPHDSLWYDETVNAYLSTQNWSTIWEWSTAIDNQPPLHFFALKIWGGAVGTSEFSLRTFSVLCGILTLAGIMRLGQQVSGLRWGSWLTGIFLALSGSFLYAVVEVRTYMLALLLLVWATVFLLRIWGRPHPAAPTSPACPADSVALGQSRHAVTQQSIYIILLILLIVSHYTAWFGVATHGLFISITLLQRRGQGWQRAVSTALILVSALAVWFLALDGRDFNEGTAFAGDVSAEKALDTYWQFFVFGQKIVNDAGAQMGYLFAGLICLSGLVWLALDRDRWQTIVLSASLVLVPLGAMLVAITQVEAKLSGRHTWVMWLGVILILGSGLGHILKTVQMRFNSRVLTLFMCVLGLSVPSYIALQTNNLDDAVRSDFRTAFAILEEDAEPTDILILRDGTLFTAAEYYQSPLVYTGLPADKITNINHRVQPVEAQQIIESVLDAETTAIWVLSWQGDNQDPLALGWAWGEYLSQGIREVWLEDAPNGEPSQVSLIRYPLTASEHIPLLEHVNELPDVLKISTDGPGLIGYEIYPMFSETPNPTCAVASHVWWWRGEVDYPSARISLRVYDADNQVVAISDQGLTGFSLEQEDWLAGTPILGRVSVEPSCAKFVSGENYEVELYIYSVEDKFTPQTVDATQFIAP